MIRLAYEVAAAGVEVLLLAGRALHEGEGLRRFKDPGAGSRTIGELDAVRDSTDFTVILRRT